MVRCPGELSPASGASDALHRYRNPVGEATVDGEPAVQDEDPGLADHEVRLACREPAALRSNLTRQILPVDRDGRSWVLDHGREARKSRDRNLQCADERALDRVTAADVVVRGRPLLTNAPTRIEIGKLRCGLALGRGV